jgi:hypothetical protein
VVLGLAVTLAKKQQYGAVPATTGYESFVGAFGVLAALVGFAALFVEVINGPISWAFDALAMLTSLAGGIVSANSSYPTHWALLLDKRG